ncbi:dTDP-4-dehydrorhamnose 3,5-epimerase family protein [Patescibacteria group bacterium]
MIYNLFDLTKIDSYKLIEDTVIHPLKVNKDPRGILVEIMKKDWDDIYDEVKLPFSQTYYSITDSGVARDEDLWHHHPGGQQDRFGVIKGEIVVAVYDWRKNSSTFGKLNLFHMGELEKGSGQYIVLIPKNCLHGFVVVSKKPAVLFNYPTRLYDSNEEERIPLDKAKLEDGSAFSWNNIRKEFKIPAK